MDKIRQDILDIIAEECIKMKVNLWFYEIIKSRLDKEVFKVK